MSDYFHGVKPSDLKNLDNHQLHVASQRLFDTVASGVGTKEELANASEALEATYKEARSRRSTMHDGSA